MLWFLDNKDLISFTSSVTLALVNKESPKVDYMIENV